MNYYILDSFQKDRDFLDNKNVECTIAFSEKDRHDIEAGKNLVVQLSNRKKYKGQIVSVDVMPAADGFTGTMTIRKA